MERTREEQIEIANDGEEIQGADHNRRQINKMARLGYKIFIVQ